MEFIGFVKKIGRTENTIENEMYNENIRERSLDRAAWTGEALL